VPFVDLSAQYPTIATEINEAVAKVIHDTDFILGREVGLFEEEFAAYCEAKYAVGVDSGTSALELALRAYEIGPGDEVITAAANGRLSEAFGAGTAAVVSPVSAFVYKGEEVKVGDGKVGPLAQRLFDEISDIQRGLRPDPHGWVVEVDE